MIRAAFGTAIALYVVFAGIVISECRFLLPLVARIWQDYGYWLSFASAWFIVNLAGATYVLLRKVLLSNTGRKLSHLERQLRGTSTISEELTARIERRQ